MSRFAELFPRPLPIIGAIRLPPLPDRPGSPGIDGLIEHALADVEVLADGGADGVLIVNENDSPHRVRAQPETIAAMTRIVRAVIEARSGLTIGCQILLNDPIASLAVARTTGADFVRCDHFVDPMHRPDHGIMAIDPDGLLAYRREIDADDILLLADIQVRDATMIDSRSLHESARQAALHLADAIIVTGPESGTPPTATELKQAMDGIENSGHAPPLLLGGGLQADNARELLPLCSGAIVATSLIAENGEWPRIQADSLAGLMRVTDELRGG